MPAKSYAGGVGTNAIQAAPATVLSVSVNAAATATLTLFDNASTGTGTVLFQQTFPAATIATYSFAPTSGLKAANGVTAVVGVATCQVTLNVQ